MPGTWRRATELRPEWAAAAAERRPLLEHARAADVLQGGAGNCWLLAAIASVAENRPQILERIFRTKTHNPEGQYEIELTRRGQPTRIWVNDEFPHVLAALDGQPAQAARGAGLGVGVRGPALWVNPTPASHTLFGKIGRREKHCVT